jgi:hypothetical protein
MACHSQGGGFVALADYIFVLEVACDVVALIVVAAVHFMKGGFMQRGAEKFRANAGVPVPTPELSHLGQKED